MPMKLGSTPADAEPAHRASGFRPSASAFLASMISTADAPSLSEEDFPP